MKNESNLLVVLDTSGSMKEFGKNMLIRNLLAYIRESFRFNSPNLKNNELKVISFADKAQFIIINNFEDTPQINFEGKTNVEKIIELLQHEIKNDETNRILFLTDGNFTNNEIKKIEEWRVAHPDLLMRSVAIGPDSSIKKLKKITGEGTVYKAEEITTALKHWPIKNEAIQPPLSIKDIANKYDK